MLTFEECGVEVHLEMTGEGGDISGHQGALIRLNQQRNVRLNDADNEVILEFGKLERLQLTTIFPMAV